MEDDFILEIDNVLPPELCKTIIDKFENDDKFQIDGNLGGTSNLFVNKQWKDSKELCINQTPGWEQINQTIRPYFLSAISKYIEHVKNICRKVGIEEDGDLDFVCDHTFPPLIVQDHMIQKIPKDRHYRWHQDYEASEYRMFTTFIYLNTIGTNEGGKTDFVSGRSVQPIEGKMVIFPSTWTQIHTGRLVKADAKYILVTNVSRNWQPK